MSAWVAIGLTITGLEKELKRLVRCFTKAKEDDHYPRCFRCDGRRLKQPVGAGSFDFRKLARAKPKNSEQWILNRWGPKGVACRGRIEVAAGEVKLAWVSELESALYICVELAELFPLLTMTGGYFGYQLLFVGGARHRAAEVRCHGGSFTHINKSRGEITCFT